MAEQPENYVNDTLDESTKIDSTPYLKIAEHGRSSRTKALKLKIDFNGVTELQNQMVII